MKSSSKRLIYVMFFIYAQLCFILSLRGNVFSIVQTDYHLDYSHIATLTLISGLSMQLATYFSGLFMKRWGHVKVLVLGLVISGISIFLIFFVRSILFFDLLFVLFMFGFGMATLVLNMLTGTLAGESKGKALMRLHLGASVGICIAPSLFVLLNQWDLSWQMIMGLSSLPVFILIVFVLINKSGTIGTYDSKDIATQVSTSNNFNNFIIILFILIFSCSQAWEHGVGTWFIIYTVKTSGITEADASRYLTLFFVCFPIIRLTMNKFMDYLNYRMTLLIAFMSNFILVLIALLSHQFIFISLTGIFTCLMYPIMISMMQDIFGGNRSDLIGFICMVGGIIQYVLMWTIGKIGDSYGIEIGFGSLIIYILIGGICVFLINPVLSKLDIKSSTTEVVD